ncbi:ribonuclease P protein component [Mycoplasma wenyonii]|uniref:Ribonuclease P protein component n=1 Tax=Mycoplasma wenyonii TaxID=65123 RepID=A0A328PVW5_9MOLU|nr:ribonuclease P protein component [Mycoplasma wenyonii]RAO95279.1 ribonuclease P protein component [Mycoplasma wenyonii]
MKKKYRLLKKKEFEKVFNDRSRIKTQNLIFLYVSNLASLNQLKNIKIGIIVPKKKWKKAVDRNYLKRVIWALNSSYQLDKFPKTLSIFLFTNLFHSNYKGRKVNFQELKKEIEKIYSIFLSKCS